MQAKDLKRYYGLQFVTSSLEKKAEVAKLKAKLDQDSIRVPSSPTSSSPSPSHDGSDYHRKPQIQPSAAYEIAASAASYVQLRAKDLLSRASRSQPDLENAGLRGIRDNCEGCEAEGAASGRDYKSEVAAYVAASTMTAVVAAGEREKQEAAMALQSLHSSPCEWFVCDDCSSYTRCFVIQVNSFLQFLLIYFYLENRVVSFF